ncbi:MAG: MFS transporter, partial [Firmicutes bacterium]|nr:MFS transporter [Bacillota bacterium]
MNNTMNDSVKITGKEKFFYGLGDLSANILLAAFSFYLLFFMVSVGGLKPALASLVFLSAKIWDAVTDVWMGRISDSTKSGFGKRRVYMIFGAVPYGLMFIILWLCPFSVESSQYVKFVYYLMAYCLFNTTYTVVYVPYNSLTANITDDYDQRSSLTTVRIVLANVGLILGAALFGLFAGDNTVFSELFVSAGYARFDAIKYSYLLSSAIFGLLAGITMLISGINVKERYTGSEEKNPYGLFATLSQFIKMKEFRFTTA